MGDYTNGQLIIYKTTPEDAVKLVEFIDEHGLEEDWGSSSDNPIRKIKLGATYGNNDASVGLVLDTNLSKEAPNTIYKIWTDPKYEFTGDMEIHVPDLGLFYAECDADGDPMFRISLVEDVLNGLPTDASVEQVREAFQAKAGKRWEEALDAVWNELAPTLSTGTYVEVKPDYRSAAHREPNITRVDEDSDRGANTRWAAFCNAEAGDFACGWAGSWRYADEFVEAAQRANDKVDARGQGQHTDPGQLAFEQAEEDGKQHLRDEGIDVDA